jgi:DNA repair exonuclease SbcCD nuclease subunit
MESEIKILIMSDLHLGIRNDEIHIPQYARNSTFRRIMAIARVHDILLIGGDLIDNCAVDGDIIDMVKTEFSKVNDANTRIVYTPGIGELNGEGTIASLMYDLNASCIFSGSAHATPYQFMKDDQKLYIYGVPAAAGYDISLIKKISGDGFHIGLFHVDFDFDRNNNEQLVYKLQKNDIRALGLDFYAFGFCHNFRMFKIIDRIIGVCPGSPEATSFDEMGDRYIISVTIKDNKLHQIKRLTVNSMKLHQHRFDCSGMTTMGPIKELLENNKSKKMIQKIIISGGRDFVLHENELRKYQDYFFKLDIIDESNPTVESLIEEFQYENSLRGEFYKILKEHIDRNDIPHDIDEKDLARSLNTITRKGFHDLEEWLCTM